MRSSASRSSNVRGRHFDRPVHRPAAGSPGRAGAVSTRHRRRAAIPDAIAAAPAVPAIGRPQHASRPSVALARQPFRRRVGDPVADIQAARPRSGGRVSPRRQASSGQPGDVPRVRALGGRNGPPAFAAICRAYPSQASPASNRVPAPAPVRLRQSSRWPSTQDTASAAAISMGACSDIPGGIVRGTLRHGGNIQPDRPPPCAHPGPPPPPGPARRAPRRAPPPDADTTRHHGQVMPQGDALSHTGRPPAGR